MADYNSSYTGTQIDNAVAAGLAVRTTSGLLKSNGSGTVSAATAGTDYQIPVSSTTVSSAGLCSFKSSGGTTLFTLQLPLWSGSVT